MTWTDPTLDAILNALYRSHAQIDTLQTQNGALLQRNADLEAQVSMLAAMQRGELPSGWRLVKDRDV